MKERDVNKPHPAYDRLLELCLHSLIEDSTAPAFLLDLSYNYIDFNNAHLTVMKQLYGIDIKPGMSLLECMPVNADRARAKKNIDFALQSGERFVAEDLSGDEKLTRRYFEITHLPVKDNDNNVVGVAVTAHDITERKLSKYIISATETRYRELFNHISSGVAVYEAVDEGNDFIIRDFNRAACAIEKVRREDVLGKSVRKAFPGVVEFGLFTVFQRVWKTGVPEHFPVSEYRDKRISGWRENYIYRLPSGEIVAVYHDVTGQKQLQEKLELINERLELALRGANLGLYDNDLIKGDTFVNDHYYNMLGYSPGEINADQITFLDRIHPDDLQPVLNKLDEHFHDSTGGLIELEYRIQHKSGSWIWIIDRCRVVGRDENGQPVRIAGTRLDITERKLAEEALRKSECAYRNIFETVPVGIFNSTVEGKLIAANVALARILGYEDTDECMDAANSVGIAEAFFINPSYRAEIMKDVKAKPGWSRHEVEYKRKDGSIITCLLLMRAVRRDDGSINHLEGFIEDITARKQALEALEQQREEYRTIFDSVPAFVAYMDSNDRYIRINWPAAISIGFKPKEMVGKTLFDIFPHDEAATFSRMHAEVRKTGIRMPEAVIKYTTRQGEIRYSQNDIVPYHDRNGKIVGTIILGQDITEKLKTEHSLKLSYEALQRALEGSVDAIAKIVEMKDPYTAGHQARVAELAVAIAGEMGLSAECISFIKTAARLHDVGKIYVPSDILSKPGSLSKIEFEIIKTHAQGSHDILKSIDFPGPIAKIALQHHERMNGSGYPHGISGNEIILEARILAVADVVEAMSSFRPYRAAIGIDKALDEIQKGSGRLYETEAVDACVRLFREKGFKFEIPRAF